MTDPKTFPRAPLVIHVLPVGDLFSHDESAACHCKPRIEQQSGGFVVSHNSYDGRELVEYDAAESHWNVGIGTDSNPRHKQREGLENDEMSTEDFSLFLTGFASNIIPVLDIERWSEMTGQQPEIIK
jgi:hypothetical protein